MTHGSGRKLGRSAEAVAPCRGHRLPESDPSGGDGDREAGNADTATANGQRAATGAIAGRPSGEGASIGAGGHLDTRAGKRPRRAASLAARAGCVRGELATGDPGARDDLSSGRARSSRPRRVDGLGWPAGRRPGAVLAERADGGDLRGTARPRWATGGRGDRRPVRGRPRREARAAGARRAVRPRAVPADAHVRRRPERLLHRSERRHARRALEPVRVRPGHAATATGRPVGADEGLQPRAGEHAERRRRPCRP